MSSGNIRSMTGFAATQGVFDNWSWTIELRSVNGRGLDLRFRMPDWIEGLETEARKRLQSALKRGNVSLNLRLQNQSDVQGQRLNGDALAAALSVLAEVSEAARAAGLVVGQAMPTEIAAMRGVLESDDAQPVDQKPLLKALLESFDQCLADFIADRAREGAALAQVIGGQIDTLGTLQAQAGELLGDRSEAQSAQLKRNLARLLDAAEMPDDQRLLQEMAIVAVKSDITEELDRLTAHIAAAKELLQSSDAVGRKFDFLMQEFNREANTLCSKSQYSELTAIGLEMKTVIDQMREQVQNVE